MTLVPAVSGSSWAFHAQELPRNDRFSKESCSFQWRMVFGNQDLGSSYVPLFLWAPSSRLCLVAQMLMKFQALIGPHELDLQGKTLLFLGLPLNALMKASLVCPWANYYGWGLGTLTQLEFRPPSWKKG